MPITYQSPLFLRGRYLRHLGWVIFATVTLQGLLLYLALPVATGIAARTVQSFSNPFMRAVNWLSALGAIGILLFPVEFTQFSRRMFVLGSCYAALVGVIAEYSVRMTSGEVLLALRVAVALAQATALAILFLETRARYHPHH